MKSEFYNPYVLKNICTPKQAAERGPDAAAKNKQQFCLTFGGGGWRCMFFIGLLYFLETCLGREELQKRWKFAGESGGSAFAVYAGLGIKVSDLAAALRMVAKKAYEGTFRGALDSEAIGNESLERALSGVTDDDVKANSHRILLSTNVIDVCRALSFQGVLQPQVMTDFRTVREIKHAVNCSAYIPGPHPIFKTPALRGKFCCDGGMTVGGSVPTFDNCVIVYSLCCGAPYSGVPAHFNDPSIAPNKYQDCSLLSLISAPSPSEFDAMILNGYNQTAKFFVKYGLAVFQLKLNIPHAIKDPYFGKKSHAKMKEKKIKIKHRYSSRRRKRIL